MRSNMLAAVTIVLWATMPALAKSLISNLPSLETLAISSFMAFAFLLAMNRVTGSLKKLRFISAEEILTMSGLGFLGLFLYSALYYYGLSRLSSQEACILNYLWPIMIVIFSQPILGERLTRRKLAAIFLSFSGIVVISIGSLNSASVSTSAIGGIISCILAAACYGLFSVLNKRRRLDQSLTMMIIWLTTGVCATISGMLIEDWLMINLKELIGLLWLGIGTNAIAYLTWALALERADNTAQIANLAYLVPILAIVVSTFVFDEPLMPSVIPALILILCGIIIQHNNTN